MEVQTIGKLRPLALMVLLIPTLMAQDVQEHLVRLSIQRIDPEQTNEWIALRKEYAAAVKASGLPGGSGWQTAVWQTVIGPTNQFVAVYRIDGFSYFDPDPDRPAPMSPADWRNWVGRMQKCLVERTVEIWRSYPDIQIPHELGDGARVQYVTFIENEPTKGRALAEFFRDEVLPAYKKAGHKGVFLGRSVAGATGRTLLFRRVAKDFETLGSPWMWAPLIEALGEDKARPVIERGSAMIKGYKTYGNVLRLDLSFWEE